MLEFLGNLLDYFFYKKCYLCGKKAEHGLMCDKCFEKIKTQKNKRIKYYQSVPIEGYFIYKDEFKKLIRAIKYHDKKELAAPIAKILSEVAEFPDNVELVPVPLHEKRQKQRKYNHMELIASQMGCKVNNNLIKRVKDTRAQYRLTQQQRRSNLDRAFKVYPEAYNGKKIILFDDICTTGATMEELIGELRKNGISNIAGLVICFTPLF